MTIAIEAHEIKKSYRSKEVLHGINLTVKEGSIFGLVGLNGIGKTTLLKILLGLAQANSGEIKILGLDSASNAAKRKFSFLPEKFNPSNFLTGEEFLRLSLQFHGKSYVHQKAEQLAEALDLNPADLKKQISKYSKGMGQKLGLISVFLAETQLLILDEPMSGLDPRARIALKRQMLEYKSQGNTIFFSSHIMADVEEICDEIGIIHNGQILYNGATQNLIKVGGHTNLETAFLSIIDK